MTVGSGDVEAIVSSLKFEARVRRLAADEFRRAGVAHAQARAAWLRGWLYPRLAGAVAVVSGIVVAALFCRDQ